MRWLDCWKLKILLPSLLNHFSLSDDFEILCTIVLLQVNLSTRMRYIWRWDWMSFNSCVVNSCSNWHVGPLGFSISDNLETQSSNEIVLWKDMLFFSISIWEVVDWTEYFQFQTISLNGCEVWDCFVIEGKEHSVFFYGKSNIVFLLDYCFSVCFFCFCWIIVSLSVPLCSSWIDCFSPCFFCVSFFLFFNRDKKHLAGRSIFAFHRNLLKISEASTYVWNQNWRKTIYHDGIQILCVRERERATRRARSYSQTKKGEGNIRAYVQKLRLLLEMKRKYRMQVPWRRRRKRRRSSDPIFLPRGRVHPLLLQVNQAFFILSLRYIIIHHHNHHHHHHLSSSSSQAFCCSALNLCVVHWIW